MRTRNSILLAAFAIAIGAGLPALPAQAESIVRYGISMADIPLTTGQPDRGAGAYQFTAYTIYDPLVAWEMDVSDRPGKLVSGLATEWKVDPNDKTKWRFSLRKGVKFHDGSDFNADAVIWNLDKVLNDKAPQFDKRQSAQVKTRLPSVASYAKIDDFTVEITTKTVDSFFPYQMLWFLVSSPAQYEKLGKDWDKFASQPSGTGPFKLTKLVPRELAELTKNADYWDKKRLPKADKIVLIPMPEALTRTNALLAGPVELIETAPPSAVPPMNEFLQQSFKDIGIDIDFKVVELETLYTAWRKGAADEMNAGITSNNIAYVTSDPLYAIVRFFHSGQIAPVGVNWGGYKNPKVDALIDEAKQTFDVAKQDELLAQAHALIVDDAVLVWVVHDTNPHALSPKVQKFVQAQHWFQDLTTIGVE